MPRSSAWPRSPQAQRFRTWFRDRVREVFRDVDVVLTPTTPYGAPRIGAPRATTVDGIEVMPRGHLGVFTQPLSFVGRGCSGLRRGRRPTASSPRRSRRRAPRLWARALSDRPGRAAPR
ncbi:MAG: hypothetical protein DMD94_02400 [Candidatus Rokuibacteriota bacterium]|nr:MAG: hypothetical protein DMD94_02400 [Candidatus Rokubacteria bacterium]